MTRFENCPACGHKPVIPIEGDYRTLYLDRKGLQHDLVVPDVDWQKCEACGEEFIDDDATSKIERARRTALGRLSAEQLKEWRSSLHKTQREMSELLGFGLKTYCRWESGAYIPSVAADLYMRLVMAKSENLTLIAELTSSPGPEAAHVGVESFAPELQAFEVSLTKQGERFADMMEQGIVFAPMNESVY